MTKFLTSVLLLFSLSLFGQDAQPGYQIIKNNPGNLSCINIGIDPLLYAIDAGNSNDAFSERLQYSALATVMYKNRFVTDVSYTRSYTKKDVYTMESSNGMYANPKNDIKNFSDFSVVGKYYFLKNMKLRRQDISLKDADKKRSTLQTNVNVCSMWGLRGGLSMTQKPIDGENADIYGYDTKDPNHTEVLFNTNYLTMARFTTVSLGLSFCRVYDMILNIDGHGQKNRFINDEIYFDVQRVISTSFDNMKGPLPGTSVERTLKVTDVGRNDWGFKIGTMSSNNNRWGLRLGMEAGLNAVPVHLTDDGGTNTFFFNFRLGIVFAQRFNQSHL